MKNKCSFAKPVVAATLAGLLVLAGCASQSSAPVVGRDGQPSAAYPGAAAKDVYTVKKGDTLYSIAREHGMDHRELIALNGIENPNNIAVGRVLRVRSQGATVAPVTSDVVVTKPIVSEAVVETRPLGAATDAVKREPKAGKEPYSDQELAQAQNQASGNESGGKTEFKAEKPVEASAKTAEETWVWPASGKLIGNYSDNGNKGIDIDGKKGDPILAAGDGKVIHVGMLRGYGNMVIVKHSSGLISVYAHTSKMLVRQDQMVTKGQKIAELGNTDADQFKLHFEIRQMGKALDPLKYLPGR